MMKNNSYYKFIIIFLTLIGSVFILFILNNIEKKNIKEYLIYKNQNINQQYEATFKEFKLISDYIYLTHFDKKDFKNLFFIEDNIEKKKKIYNYLSPIFNKSKNFYLNNFHIYSKDNKSIVNFNNLIFNDEQKLTSRKIIKKLNNSNQDLYGFDICKTTTGYRFFYKIEYNNNHIGIFEISFSFKSLAKELQENFNLKSNLILNKEKLENMSFYNEYKETPIKSLMKHKEEDNIYINKYLPVLNNIYINDKIKENFNNYLNKKNYLSNFIDYDNNDIIIIKPLINKINQELNGFYIIYNNNNSINNIIDNFLIIKIISIILFILINFYFYKEKLKRIKYLLHKKKLSELAEKDDLTKIYNKRIFNEFLKKEIRNTKRNYNVEKGSYIILFDIDNFKKINDEYGHIVGDNVLKELSEIVKSTIRENDIFARWGGEEFVIIAKSYPISNSLVFAEKIRKLVEETKLSDLNITISLGIAKILKNDNEESLIKRADRFLYEAKRTGKNKVCYEQNVLALLNNNPNEKK